MAFAGARFVAAWAGALTALPVALAAFAGAGVLAAFAVLAPELAAIAFVAFAGVDRAVARAGRFAG